MIRDEFKDSLTDFLVFRQGPSEWQLWAGPWDSLSSVRVQNQAIFINDFWLQSKTPWRQPKQRWRLSSEELLELCATKASSGPSRELDEEMEASETSFANAQQSFEQIQSWIRSGEIKKAVPIASRYFTGFQPWRALRRLVSASAELHPYACFLSDGSGFIGVTPELLFSRAGSQLETMALAGTRPRFDQSRVPLFADPKELKEHQLVIQDVEDKLRAFGTIRRGLTRELELPSLIHLHTSLSCSLESSPSDAEIIQAMHPTAALGASPRSWDWRKLRDLPGQADRGYFGAPLGWMDGARSSYLVAIRQIAWQAERCSISAGCGVVAESAWEREEMELKAKIESSLDFFDLKVAHANKY